MTNANSIRIAGKSAIIAALMGGASVVFAQDAVPAAPVTAAPSAEQTFTPPPAVSTLPTPNDVVNPIAAQDVVTEAAEKREPRPAAAAPVARPRVAVQPAKPTIANAVDSASPIDVSPLTTGTSINLTPPAVDAAQPANTVIDDGAVIGPAKSAAATGTDAVNENLPIYGGFAAAMAAIAAAAALVSRRRRRVSAGQSTEVAPRHVAPRPIKDDPVFQQFAAPSAPEPVIQRAPTITRADMPVTDPLFSAQAIAGPISDPLFGAKAEVPPITDPMFAHLAEYEGNGVNQKPTSAFNARRDWNDVSQRDSRMPRELEPAA